MIEIIIKLITMLSVITWVSFTIFIIIPKLEGVEMTVGLGIVVGIITAAFTWMEKWKIDERICKMKHVEENNEKP